MCLVHVTYRIKSLVSQPFQCCVPDRFPSGTNSSLIPFRQILSILSKTGFEMKYLTFSLIILINFAFNISAYGQRTELYQEVNETKDQAGYEIGPEMNSNRIWHHAIVTPNGNVALIGGIKEGFVSLNTTEIFNPNDGTFTSYTMNHTHAAPTIAKMEDGRYLIAGGSADYGVPKYDDAEIFDPSDLTFITVGSMVRFRANGGSAALLDGSVLIAGAWWTHNDAHTMGEMYNVAEQTFSGIGPFTVSRARSAVVPSKDGGAMIVGGVSPRGESLNLPVEEYDTGTGEITVLEDYIINENEAWTINADQTITAQQLTKDNRYLFTAYFNDGIKTHYKLVSIDPQSKAVDVVQTDPSIPYSDELSIIGQPIVDRINNYAYLLVRDSGSDVYSISVITVDLTTGQLIQASNSHEPESYHLYSVPAVLLNDGRIFVSGGSVTNNFDAVNKTLFITPPVPQATSSENVNTLPREIKLRQNYPNPFNPTTVIEYTLPISAEVRMEVYNMVGEKVSTLLIGQKSAGSHSVTFKAANLASGVYIYRLSAGSLISNRKMVLLK